MRLISEVDSLESKTQIAKTLNTVIESNAERVRVKKPFPFPES